MRIIGGTYKGKRINPSNFKARPTTDFARESLFNILNNRVDFGNIEVLDLFSGTGSISYEFASRGTAMVHLVEKDSGHIAGIKKVLKEMELQNVKAIHIDVRAYLKTCNYKYDIVFADPPYSLPWIEEIPDLVIQAGIIKENGFFILEHPRDLKFTENRFFFEHRNYGSVNFSFFRSLSGDL